MYTSLLINLTQFSLNPLNTLESTTWLKIGFFITALGTSFFIYQNSDFLSECITNSLLCHFFPTEITKSLGGFDIHGNQIKIEVTNGLANIFIKPSEAPSLIQYIDISTTFINSMEYSALLLEIKKNEKAISLLNEALEPFQGVIHAAITENLASILLTSIP